MNPFQACHPKQGYEKGKPEPRQGEQQQGCENQTKLKMARHSRAIFVLHSSPWYHFRVVCGNFSSRCYMSIALFKVK